MLEVLGGLIVLDLIVGICSYESPKPKKENTSQFKMSSKFKMMLLLMVLILGFLLIYWAIKKRKLKTKNQPTPIPKYEGSCHNCGAPYQGDPICGFCSSHHTEVKEEKNIFEW